MDRGKEATSMEIIGGRVLTGPTASSDVRS